MTSANAARDGGWIDASVPIVSGMVSFPGDPLIHLERASAISAGGICNVSRLDFGGHSGTHVDAPVHFIDGASGVERIPLEVLVGPALVVDASAIDGHLDANAVAALGIRPGTKRLLLRWNSALGRCARDYLTVEWSNVIVWPRKKMPG